MENFHLVYITLKGERRTFKLNKDTFILGRDMSVDLPIPDSAVSRMHLEVTIEAGKSYIKDLSSANGTYVNGARLEALKRVLFLPEMTLYLGGETGAKVEIFPAELKNLSLEPVQSQPLTPAVSEQPLSEHAKYTGLYEEHKTRLDRLLFEITTIEEDFLKQKKAQSSELEALTQSFSLLQKEDREIREQINSGKNLLDTQKTTNNDLKVLEKELITKIEKIEENLKKSEEAFKTSSIRFESLSKNEALMGQRIEDRRVELKDLEHRNEQILAEKVQEVSVLDSEIWKKSSEIERRESEALNRHKSIENQLNDLKLQQVSEEVLLQSLRVKKNSLEKELLQLKQASEAELLNQKKETELLRNEIIEINRNMEVLKSKEKKQVLETEKTSQALQEMEAKLSEATAQYSVKENEQQDVLRKLRVEMDGLEAENQVKKLKLQIQREEIQLKLSLQNKELQSAQLSKVAVEEEIGKFRVNSESELLKTQQKIVELEQLAIKTKEEEQALQQETQKIRITYKGLEQEIADLQAQIITLKTEKNGAQENFVLEQNRISAENKRLRDAAEVELKAYELAQKGAVDKNFEVQMKKMETDVAATQVKELERIKKLQEEERKSAKDRLQTQITEIVNFVKSNQKEIETPEFDEKLQLNIEMILSGKTRNLVSEATAKKTRRFWRKIGISISIPAAVVLTYFIFPNAPTALRASISRYVASNQSETGVFLEQIKSRSLKYQPVMDRVFRGSYLDNILYVEKYVGMKLSDREQKGWTLALNSFFTGRLALDDRVVVEFVSAETVMVQEMMAVRETMVEQYKEQSLARMNEIEKQGTLKLMKMLQGEDNYKRFRIFEQSFYADFLKREGSL